jgi:hypothetical protein
VTDPDELAIDAMIELMDIHIGDNCTRVECVDAANGNPRWTLYFEWEEVTIKSKGRRCAHRVSFNMLDLDTFDGRNWNECVLLYLKDIPRISWMVDWSQKDMPPAIAYIPKRRIQIRRKSN